MNEELEIKEMQGKIRTLNAGHRAVLEGALAHLLLEKDEAKAYDTFTFLRNIVKQEETTDLFKVEEYITYCDSMRELAARTEQSYSEARMGDIIDYYKSNRQTLQKTLEDIRVTQEFEQIRRNFFQN